jgi:hypothetical protein
MQQPRARIMAAILPATSFDPREPVLDTLAEIDEQLDLLRKRKVGATAVDMSIGSQSAPRIGVQKGL